jgi:type II restriction enzyme
MDKDSQILDTIYYEVKKEKKWKGESKCIGEAAERYILAKPCIKCNSKLLQQYKPGEKGKDINCQNCNSKFQIKATKSKREDQTSLKLLGADYKSTCSSIKCGNIDYIILKYSIIDDKYTITDMYFIDHKDITESCIIPRNPLSSTAIRAGWQGCMLVFNTFKSLKSLK